ncbi:septum formation initiator family protein [Hydrogenoanaerobacterium sp.]|uniref:FtsB family cell division protein n=1 Tax=Hydrogenoanaerobacterium sp. TaxID=2953763 RepID=UPI00289F4ADA|nr:septum formation initiator family protein [Hydrogenoanaerobacterium sp.]
MRKAKEKKNGKARLLKFAVCVFVVYVVYMMIQQQFDIKDRQLELAMLQQQVDQQRLENKEIERLLASDNEEYVERLAKDEYGYAYPDETIYIDTSGS